MNKFVALVLLALLCIASASNFRTGASDLTKRNLQVEQPICLDDHGVPFAATDDCICDMLVAECECWQCWIVNNELVCIYNC